MYERRCGGEAQGRLELQIGFSRFERQRPGAQLDICAGQLALEPFGQRPGRAGSLLGP